MDVGVPGAAGPGVSVPATLRPEVEAEASALLAMVGAGLVEISHVEDCMCDGDRYQHACLRNSMTVRQRQREQNAAFQADHLERRAHGLEARHAAKLARMHNPGTTET